MRSEEDTYWWYVALRSLVVMYARPILKNLKKPRVLDAGCGTGGNLEVMRDHFSETALFGVDIDPQAVEFSKQRSIAEIQQASVEALPFRNELFDLVVSLDVLYFKDLDDKKAIVEFTRVLKAGGYLIMNLPAFKFLRGQHDVAVSTARRYTKKDVKQLVMSADLTIIKSTYWNMIFSPVLLLWRPLSLLFTRKRETAQSDLKRLPFFLNQILKWAALSEAWLTRRLSLPFGSSIFIVARKNGARV